MEQSENDTTEDVEIEKVLHDGWTISVRAKEADGGAGLVGSAVISRAGALRCKLMTSAVFHARQQLVAVMVAKADKWVALQAQSSDAGECERHERTEHLGR